MEGRARLCSEIVRDGETFLCWFDYPAEYQQFICSERCDAFLVALIPYAMCHGMDVICKAALSEKLAYKMREYYIPAMSKYQKGFQNIELTADELSGADLCAEHAVGTGMSCGVDSFYTTLKHGNQVPEHFRITHLVSMNVGSFGPFGGEKSYGWFQEELKNAARVSKQLGLPLIDINSNLMEFYQEDHTNSGTFRMMGAILGLQKLFSMYYISSGYMLDEFDITAVGNTHYDLVNCECGQNESTCFYTFGSEMSRFEKTEYVAKAPVTYDFLTVCERGNKNCGKCEKCIRTMSVLYSMGDLDKYDKAFDIQYFKDHRKMMFAKARYYSRGRLYGEYAEVLQFMKKDKMEFLQILLLEYFIFIPYCFVRDCVKGLFSEKQYEKLKQRLKHE